MFARCFALSRLVKLAQRQQPSVISGVRTLFSARTMGIDQFTMHRESQIEQTKDTSERFRTKMGEFVDPSSTNLVFTEDLKLMIHIANNEKDDLMLLEKMMKKFHNQNKELRFGSYTFGPVVMRLYSLFNLPREALKLFRDPDLDGFFDQMTTFAILGNLLLKNEMYDEVVEVYEAVRDKQIQQLRFPRNLITLVFGALYKQNTPEAYQKCVKYIKEMDEASHHMVRRTISFAAALAINQNQPIVALELLGRLRSQNYITVKNLKIISLAAGGRADDALPILRSVLERDVPPRSAEHGGEFLREVIDKLEEEVQKMDQKEVTIEFNRIKEILEQQNAIIDKTIDSLLMSEIDVDPHQRDRPYFDAGSNTRNPRDREDGYGDRNSGFRNSRFGDRNSGYRDDRFNDRNSGYRDDRFNDRNRGYNDYQNRSFPARGGENRRRPNFDNRPGLKDLL